MISKLCIILIIALSIMLVITIVISLVLAKYGKRNLLFKPRDTSYSIVIGKEELVLFDKLSKSEAEKNYEMLSASHQPVKIIKEDKKK